MQERHEQLLARIPARSQQQVWDWSLVLASQGIGTIIDFSTEPPHWGLLVAPAEYQRALDAIRQFQLENRRWPWRRDLFEAEATFDAGSFAWALLVVCFFWLQNAHEATTLVGSMDADAVAAGQWWRLFTAIMLHGDLGHLLANLALGALWIGLAMGRYGTGIALLAAYLAGVLGNFTSFWLGPPHHSSLGASGMIFGALGLLAAQSVGLWWKTRQVPKRALASLLAGLMLLVLLGLSYRADVLAHCGGFAGGVLLGAVLASMRPTAGNASANLLAGLSFAVGVLVPWLIAFKQG